MNYSQQILKTGKEAIKHLNSLIKEGQEVALFVFDKEGDWHDDDRYYDLPQQFLYGKYNYADVYYLYRAYKKDGVIYVEGRELEDGNLYAFELEYLDTGNLCYLTDSIIEELAS